MARSSAWSRSASDSATCSVGFPSRAPKRRSSTRPSPSSARFDHRLETAAYFVASEALTNAAKYADPSKVSVSAGRRNGALVVRILDDGIGGAVPSPGSGLAGMTDRVTALGGSLTVESPAGRARGDGGAAVRVLIAEDQALLREGLRLLFEDAGTR